MEMTQQTVGILALVALLLPTGGAILARLVGRKFGARATRWVGGLSFAVTLGYALALISAEVDRVALGQMAIFVPAEGPLIDANAFTLPRSAPTPPVEPEVPELALVDPTATIQPATATTAPPLTPTPRPSSTAAATIMPTDQPRPTQAPLVELTVTTAPTAEPTPPAAPTPTATVAPSATTAPARTPTTAPALASEPRAYTVEVGDTLRSIAERFELSAGALQRYNGLTDAEADSLRPDQRLFIPPRSAAPPAPTSRPTARPAPPTPRPAAQPQAYIVEPGDTLRSIAESYDLFAGVLQRYNGLTDAEADSLRPGQRLFIPPR